MAQKISFCLISRDNEKTIRDTLESVKSIADEIIVVDTGSKDRTCDIVREYTSQLYHFPWQDDFSIARNESIKYAKNDWIFIIDTDEIIPQESSKKIEEYIVLAKKDKATAYYCQIQNISGDKITRIFYMERLFQNNITAQPFQGIIHERLKPVFKRLYTDIKLVHQGYNAELQLNHKEQEKRLQLLERCYQQNKDDVENLSNLLTMHISNKQFAKALEVLEGNKRFRDHPTVIFRKAQILKGLAKFQEAIETLTPLLQLHDQKQLDLRPYLLFGQLLCRQKKFAEAHELYSKVFTFTPKDIFRQTSANFDLGSYYLSLMQACYLAFDFQDHEKCLVYGHWLLENHYFEKQTLPLLMLASSAVNNKAKLIELFETYQDFFEKHENAQHFKELYFGAKNTCKPSYLP